MTAIALTIAAAFATVAALWIAVRALRVANAARADLVTERRAGFELGILREFSDAIETYGADTIRDRKWPAADLPWLRTVTDVGADPELEKLRAAMYAGTDQGSYPREMRLLLRTDNRAAIANRLKGRPTA